jgi:hypothetical protein
MPQSTCVAWNPGLTTPKCHTDIGAHKQTTLAKQDTMHATPTT